MNFIEKASRLYEQKRSAVFTGTAREMYVRQWRASSAASETTTRSWAILLRVGV